MNFASGHKRYVNGISGKQVRRQRLVLFRMVMILRRSKMNGAKSKSVILAC